MQNPVVAMVQHWKTERWSVDYVMNNPGEILPARTLYGEHWPEQTVLAQAIMSRERCLRSSHPVMELHELKTPLPGDPFSYFNILQDALRQPENGGQFFRFDGFESSFLSRHICPSMGRNKLNSRELRRTF